MKNEKLNKGLIIGGFSLLGLFVILLILPFFFQNKIAQRLLSESDRYLNAKVSIEHFHLSLIRNFPNPTLVIKGVTIENVGRFKGEKLLQADDFTATVNLFSFFSDTYKIKKVILNNPDVHLINTAKGANWDIIKSEEEQKEEEEESKFNFKFDKIVLNSANISYKDIPGQMNAKVKDLDFSLSGNLSNDFTTLKTKFTTPSVTFKMNGIKYLSSAKLKVKANIDADFPKSKYTVKDNEIKINALALKLNGWLALLENGMDMDLKVSVPQVDFKNIISLIPAIYAKNFEDIKTEGKVELSAYAKGKMNDKIYPAFDVTLKIEDAMFRYPSLPTSVNDINIDARINSPGGSLDKVILELNKFHFVVAANPFDLTAHVSTPISDPNVKATLKGILDFSQVKNIYPLDEGKSMSGIFTMNLSLAGRLSYIEKGQYEKFKASGMMAIKNLIMKNVDLFDKDLSVSTAKLTFNSAFANLENFVAAVGDNNLSIHGKVENYVSYFFSDGTLRGNMTINSTNLNVNDFLTDDESDELTSASDTTTLTLFEVPNNIDISANLSVKKLQYDNIKMRNANLYCAVSHGKVIIQNLSAQLFSGAIKMQGDYRNPTYNQGFANVDLDINTISTRNLCETFGLFDKFLPVLKNADGDISMVMKGNTYLNEKMSPDYASMNVEGVLGLLDFRLTNSETLNRINELLKVADMKTVQLKDVQIAYKVKDGKMTTQPFSFKLSKANVDVENGTIGLDKSMHYVAVITVPTSAMGSETMNVVRTWAKKSKLKVLDVTSADEIKFAVTIDGTLNQPKVSVGLNTMRTSMKETVENQVEVAKEKTQDVVNAVANKALDEAQEKADALVAAAQKKADALVAAQKEVGDKLIANARNEAQKSIDAAKNPLEKAARKKASELAIAEAEKKAAKLNAETQIKANKIVDNAKSEADKLIQSAKR